MRGMTRERPESISDDAVFDEENQLWALGEKDSQGRKIGTWTYFRDDGSKACEAVTGDGTTRMAYRRFHPDGTESQSGEKDLQKDVWVGAMRWRRLDAPSVEDRYWDKNLPENARVFEVMFNDEGHVIGERVLDAGGARITRAGAAWPAERPASVDENAILVDKDKRWLSSERTLDSSRYFGTYRVWDRNGTLLEQRSYDDGTLKRQETHKDGALWSSKEYTGDAMTQSFYRTRDGKTVIKSSTLYRNNQNDRRTTEYDGEGNPLYSVRMERVSETHVRRYDNDVLVWEAQWSKEGKLAPGVKYFDGDRLLIDYRSDGDGTGTHVLYRQDGSVEATLDVDNEANRNEYGNWDAFLPGFAYYEADRRRTDVEFAREIFLDAVDEQRFERTVAQVEVPPHLQAIHDVDWTQSRSANRTAQLDRLLVMMLGDDEALAQRAGGAIWAAIEEQDCVFTATYDVAQTLGRVVSSLRGGARQRAVKELANIVCLAAMPHEQPERYDAVVNELRERLPLLEDVAGSLDDDDGRAVLHLLSVVNAPAVLRARVVDQAASAQTRSFAACALGACRGQSQEQREATIAHLEHAFHEEGDVGVRLIVGLLVSLMRGAQGSRNDSIDGLLLRYIVHDDRQQELFDAWRPVIRFLGDDVQSMLFRALPERSRQEHIARIVDGLSDRGILDQVGDLDIIFATLFHDGKETELTPLHRKALREVADVVDKNTGFVNHGEVFRKHQMPWDSFQLRELATRA
jgi:hypothetical protein